MGVVVFCNDFGSKTQDHTACFYQLKQVENSLNQVFREIAAQNNQVLTPPASPIKPYQYQHSINVAAKKLLLSLTVLSSMHHEEINPHHTSCLINAIETLKKSIAIFEENKQQLAQILLVCSSIKSLLEKIGSNTSL